MTRELYDGLVTELPNMLATVSTCPDHLQEAYLKGMISAFIAPPHGRVYPERARDLQTQPAGDMVVAPNGNSGDWDYRRELLRLAKQHGVELKELNGQEFATFVAYVFQILGPLDIQDEGISVDVLNDASRTVDRRLPGNPSATLSRAKEKRLLDKAKQIGRYKLAPKGENLVYDMLNRENGA